MIAPKYERDDRRRWPEMTRSDVRKGSADRAPTRYEYSVYVIELDESKRRGTPKPALYVGQTMHTPEERLAQHERHEKSSRHVRGHSSGCVRTCIRSSTPSRRARRRRPRRSGSRISCAHRDTTCIRIDGGHRPLIQGLNYNDMGSALEVLLRGCRFPRSSSEIGTEKQLRLPRWHPSRLPASTIASRLSPMQFARRSTRS